MLAGVTTLHRAGNILPAHYRLIDDGDRLIGTMRIDAPVVLSTFMPDGPDDTLIADLETGERFRFVVTATAERDVLRVAGELVP